MALPVSLKLGGNACRAGETAAPTHNACFELQLHTMSKPPAK